MRWPKCSGTIWLCCLLVVGLRCNWRWRKYDSRESGFHLIGFCGIVAHLWHRIVHGTTRGLVDRIRISYCVTGTRHFVGYLACWRIETRRCSCSCILPLQYRLTLKTVCSSLSCRVCVFDHEDSLQFSSLIFRVAKVINITTRTTL